MSQWKATATDKKGIVRHLIGRGVPEEEARQWVERELGREVPEDPYGSGGCLRMSSPPALPSFCLR